MTGSVHPHIPSTGRHQPWKMATALRDKPFRTVRPHKAPSAANHLLASYPRSIHQFDLARFPRLVEPRFERPIEAQDDEPAFPRNGLNPVSLMTRRCGRAKPDFHRRVGIDDDTLFLAADAWKPLVRLKHGTGLVVIEDK